MGYKGESNIYVVILYLYFCLKVFGVIEVKFGLFKRYNVIYRRNYYLVDSRVCFVYIYMYFWIAIYLIYFLVC